MICKGNFIFRGLEKRDGGNFTNDKGENIAYDASYQVKVDEIDENNKTNERKFKFSANNKVLADKFYKFNVYNPITITFNINLFSSNVKLEPIDVDIVNNK